MKRRLLPRWLLFVVIGVLVAELGYLTWQKVHEPKVEVRVTWYWV